MYLAVALCAVLHFSLLGANGIAQPGSPLPFPPCRASDLRCLRRGFRTFLFLMSEQQHYGMAPIDPMYLSSVTLAYPDIGLRYIMRNLNITGAKWTEIVDRRINDPVDSSNIAMFSNDFHISARLLINLPVRPEPYYTRIVVDIRDVQSNITYPWQTWKNGLGDSFVSVSEEEITVNKPRRITFFLESNKDEPLLRNSLENRPSILENFAKEITTTVLQNLVNNFRIFGLNVPMKYYYKA